MGDDLKKVRRGEPLRIPARAYNSFIDVARAHRESGQGFRRPARPVTQQSGTVLAYNGSGQDAPRGGIVELRNGETTEQQVEFVKPGDGAGIYGIAVEPISPDSMGLIAVSGGPYEVRVDHGPSVGDEIGPKSGQWPASTGTGLLVVRRAVQGVVVAFFSKRTECEVHYAEPDEIGSLDLSNGNRGSYFEAWSRWELGDGTTGSVRKVALARLAESIKVRKGSDRVYGVVMPWMGLAMSFTVGTCPEEGTPGYANQVYGEVRYKFITDDFSLSTITPSRYSGLGKFQVVGRSDHPAVSTLFAWQLNSRSPYARWGAPRHRYEQGYNVREVLVPDEHDGDTVYGIAMDYEVWYSSGAHVAKGAMPYSSIRAFFAGKPGQTRKKVLASYKRGDSFWMYSPSTYS